MTKTKSNASWNQLTPKQRERLDRWLFEENLSYADVLIKASRELGYKGSESSLRRYYERRRQERLLTDLKEAGQDMMEVRDLDASPDLSRKASMQMLGAYLFRVLRDAPDKVKEWAPVANLIVQNDHNEALREIKAEDQKIRREVLDFAKERFHIDVAEQALKALPELQELAEAKKDPATKGYEENIRRNRLMRLMLGAGNKIRPESDQEAREMLAAKREREASQKAEQEAAAERRRVRDEIGDPQPPTPSSQYYEEYIGAKAEEEEEKRQRQTAFRESRAKSAEAERAEEKHQTPSPQAPENHQTSSSQASAFADKPEKPQAAAATETERAERKKSQEQQEARSAESEAAEREKLRQQRVSLGKRFEELREICGWQEVERPPGWEKEK